ncbi:hotdog domain-containing protein [Yunchengibacter salinarum]|uniref:hotdog domain-containing protein n=1 Tax=Yunchengibacter salinarum TaxID=3133399 RepID=UPI0035B67AC9
MMEPATGQWHEGCFRFPIRVYYEDTDVGGMVYHGRYVSFFERVRTESLRGTPVDVAALFKLPEADGGPFTYVVRDLKVTYHRQATVGDVLIGGCMVTRVRAAAVEVFQWIDRDGERLADGPVTAAVIGADGRPRRWRDDHRAVWQGWHEDAIKAGHLPL